MYVKMAFDNCEFLAGVFRGEGCVVHCLDRVGLLSLRLGAAWCCCGTAGSRPVKISSFRFLQIKRRVRLRGRDAAR